MFVEQVTSFREPPTRPGLTQNQYEQPLSMQLSFFSGCVKCSS